MPKHLRDSSNDTDFQDDEYCAKQKAHNEDSGAKSLAPKTADDDAEEDRVRKEEEGEGAGGESGQDQEEDEYALSPPLRKRKKGRESKTWSKASPTSSSVGMVKTGHESKAGLKTSPTPSSAGMVKTERESKARSKASPTPSPSVGTAKGTAWTADEDALLLALKSHTDMPWNDIANTISTHDSKSCQNRLGKLKKDPAATEAAKLTGDSKAWTKAQDAMLKALRTAGMQWKEVASIIPGRDMKSCQNRWSKLKKEGEARD